MANRTSPLGLNSSSWPPARNLLFFMCSLSESGTTILPAAWNGALVSHSSAHVLPRIQGITNSSWRALFWVPLPSLQSLAHVPFFLLKLLLKLLLLKFSNCLSHLLRSPLASSTAPAGSPSLWPQGSTKAHLIMSLPCLRHFDGCALRREGQLLVTVKKAFLDLAWLNSLLLPFTTPCSPTFCSHLHC